MIHVIGAGLAGCIIASRNIDTILYERDKVGGLCCDNKNYQEFVHVVHTENPEVYSFFMEHTDTRAHRTKFLSYVKGNYMPWYPREITDRVISDQVEGYSRKMWAGSTPPEAGKRIRTSPDEYFFHNKYEFIPDFTKLFETLTEDILLYNRKISHGDIRSGTIVLTGPIDEYFHYQFGRLPYRGIKSTHIETEIRLQADCINFPDETIPFTRLVDYRRLGFEGNWMGIETPAKADHYPIRNAKSEAVYEKYRKLAEQEGIILAGRLATFHYMDIDEVVEQALKIRL